jgi:hypothetical protein
MSQLGSGMNHNPFPGVIFRSPLRAWVGSRQNPHAYFGGRYHHFTTKLKALP